MSDQYGARDVACPLSTRGGGAPARSIAAYCSHSVASEYIADACPGALRCVAWCTRAFTPSGTTPAPNRRRSSSAAPPRARQRGNTRDPPPPPGGRRRRGLGPLAAGLGAASTAGCVVAASVPASEGVANTLHLQRPGVRGVRVDGQHAGGPEHRQPLRRRRHARHLCGGRGVSS